MKKHFTTLFIIIIILLGASLLLYPTVSDYWNSLRQSRAIASYVEEINNMDEERYNKILFDAAEYNKKLASTPHTLVLDKEQRKIYDAQLNITGNGIMGYIDIPEISCHLPIYHGVGNDVLQVAVGHMDGSSLPVGGESSHAVLSGHRGLPSAKLFTDLDKLAAGDVFIITVLNEAYTYEIYDISTVLPNEVDGLKIEKGKDLCTLVTCTPYGVNSHRLLLKGKRIENAEEVTVLRVISEASRIHPMAVMPAVATPLLLIAIFVMYIKPVKKDD